MEGGRRIPREDELQQMMYYTKNNWTMGCEDIKTWNVKTEFSSLWHTHTHRHIIGDQQYIIFFIIFLTMCDIHS